MNFYDDVPQEVWDNIRARMRDPSMNPRAFVEELEKDRGCCNFMYPPSWEEATRAYYRETWGFDPAKAIIPAFVRNPSRYCWYRYEAEIPLNAPSDAPLKEAGVTLLARVELGSEATLRNRIVVDGKHRRAGITCIHTVVDQVPAGELEDYVIAARGGKTISSSRELVELAPEEHFVALRSWTTALAEVGLLALVQNSITKRGTRMRGFGTTMQSQVMLALHHVVPEVMGPVVKDYLLQIVDESPLDWFRERAALIDYRLHFIADLRADPNVQAALADILREKGAPLKDPCPLPDLLTYLRVESCELSYDGEMIDDEDYDHDEEEEAGMYGEKENDDDI
jgi:hypothetical protein